MHFGTGLWGVLVLGLVFGLQHAMEPDHIAAVASLANGSRSKRAVVRQATAWAVGHALMMLLVAAPAIVVGRAISDGLADWLEFTAAVMLTGLGVHVIYRLVKERMHFHVHRHADGTRHFHAHSHAELPAASGGDWREAHDIDPHAHDHAHGVPWRALSVGLMHGLAGSAALIVLSLATAGNVAYSLLFVVCFGLGTIISMAALSVAISVPLGITSRRLTGVRNAISGVVGCATMALGFVIMYQTQAHNWFG